MKIAQFEFNEDKYDDACDAVAQQLVAMMAEDGVLSIVKDTDILNDYMTEYMNDIRFRMQSIIKRLPR
jgi:hypothetical protein